MTITKKKIYHSLKPSGSHKTSLKKIDHTEACLQLQRHNLLVNTDVERVAMRVSTCRLSVSHRTIDNSTISHLHQCNHNHIISISLRPLTPLFIINTGVQSLDHLNQPKIPLLSTYHNNLVHIII